MSQCKMVTSLKHPDMRSSMMKPNRCLWGDEWVREITSLGTEKQVDSFSEHANWTEGLYQSLPKSIDSSSYLPRLSNFPR